MACSCRGHRHRPGPRGGRTCSYVYEQAYGMMPSDCGCRTPQKRGRPRPSAFVPPTIEFVQDVTPFRYIGGGPTVYEFGRRKIVIASLGTPLQDAIGAEVGHIQSCEIEGRMIKIVAYLDNTAETREAIGVKRAADAHGVRIEDDFR